MICKFISPIYRLSFHVFISFIFGCAGCLLLRAGFALVGEGRGGCLVGVRRLLILVASLVQRGLTGVQRRL